jgi:hypothetical protein
MVRSRVYGIPAGGEGQNDHDPRRPDPVFKRVADRPPDLDAPEGCGAATPDHLMAPKRCRAPAGGRERPFSGDGARNGPGLARPAPAVLPAPPGRHVSRVARDGGLLSPHVTP